MNVTRRQLGSARRLSFVAKVSFVVALVAVGAGSGELGGGSVQSAIAIVGSLAGLLCMATAVASLAAGGLRLPETARVRVDSEGLELEARVVRERIPLTSIRSALAVERRDRRSGAARGFLDLALRGGDELLLEVSTLGEAEALVARLGFGPAGRRVTVDLARPGRRWLHLLYAYLAYQLTSVAIAPLAWLAAAGMDRPLSGLVLLASYLVLALLVTSAYALMKRLFAAPVVTVGRDGVVVLWRGRQRRLSLRPGVAPHEDPALRFSALGLDSDRRWALWRLVAARASAGAPDVPAGSFERGGRDLAAWRAHLEAAMRDGSYRTAGLAPDAAARVLESVQATPEQRVGAALALRVAGEDGARIRVAAEACADEALGEALVAIADDAPESPAKVGRALRV